MILIDPSILFDDRLSSVNVDADYMYLRLWLICDKQGCFRNNADLIKAQAFALRPEVGPYLITECLKALETAKLIIPVEIEGVAHYYIPDCHQYQGIMLGESKTKGKRSKVSKVPVIKVAADAKAAWFELEKTLTENRTERWVSIKAFIDENKPDYPEPYASAWNVFAVNNNLSQVQELSDARINKFNTRIKEESFKFYDILKGIKNSEYLRGVGQSNSMWKVSWDWIFENDSNYLKIIEGQYK